MVWTPTGGGATTLADDLNKYFMKLEQLGLEGLELVVNMFGAGSKLRASLGNTGGDCVFTVKHSHATRDAAATYFKTINALLMGQGSLVYTADAVTLTMAGCIFRGLRVAEFDGLAWTLRYTFGITTIT